jgi:hypothetical protein
MSVLCQCYCCSGYYNLHPVLKSGSVNLIWWLCQLSVAVTNAMIINLQGEKFYLAHNFEGSSPWSIGPVALCLWWGIIALWEHVEEKNVHLMRLGSQHPLFPLRAHTPHDLRPPTRPPLKGSTSQQYHRLGTTLSAHSLWLTLVFILFFK